MKEVLNLSKVEVAKREVDSSIQSFFSSSDPICIHLVAASAQQILRDVCRARKIPSFFEEMKNMLKPEKRDEVLSIMKKPYNFMKHADRDSEESMTFYPAANEYIIWECQAPLFVDSESR